jgi:protein-tyrosine phosphatase
MSGLAEADHLLPSDADVDRFVALVRDLKPDAWLHFHCRAGSGRTTTFLVLYDMLRNADHLSAAEIVARQAAVPTHYDLFDARRNDRDENYQERARFVRAFHPYARAFHDGCKGSWTEWLKEQGGK